MSDHAREAFLAWRQQHPRIRRIAVLTGAGISAESGIPTFRGADNLWRGTDPTALFTPEALAQAPLMAWELYNELRQRCATAEPNAGHRALAALQQQRTLTLITQNIDGLHQRAGSAEVLELHGTLWRLRCDTCRQVNENNAVPLPALPPRCPDCGDVLRPDIVLYTEMLPERVLNAAFLAAEQCDAMLVIGTSGVVYPAAGLPALAHSHGAVVIEINPQETALSGEMDYVIRATAAEALPWVAAELVEDIATS